MEVDKEPTGTHVAGGEGSTGTAPIAAETAQATATAPIAEAAQPTAATTTTAPAAVPVDDGTITTSTDLSLLVDSIGDAASSSHFSTGLSVDVDGNMDDIDMPSTQSVRSSIYEFVEEDGRTFHKFKQGKYLMPNDENERDRLDLQHSVFLLMLKGQLYRSPLKDPKHVLDVGTGTGIWAVEFANTFPNAAVIGTDLSPIQPEFVPPNCRFEIDDAEDDWSYGPDPFDYVHFRLLWHSFSDHKRVLQMAYDNLAPGGYIEWQDFLSGFQAVDDTLKGTKLKQLDQLYVEAGRRLGRDMLVTTKVAGMMRDVGFVDVVEERYALPGNPWPKGREAKTLGLWQMTNFLEGMSAITKKLLMLGLGMSSDVVDALLAEVAKEVPDTKIHYYIPVYIMYGRKPYPHELEGGQPTAEGEVDKAKGKAEDASVETGAPTETVMTE